MCRSACRRRSCLRERLPAGAAAVLLNRAHDYHDLFLPIDVEQLRLYEAIDGGTAIAGLLERVAGGKDNPGLRERRPPVLRAALVLRSGGL